MKKILLPIAAAAIASLAACKTDVNKAVTADEPHYIVASYTWSGGQPLPDPANLNMINYAFGRVNATRDGIDIENPDRFRQVVTLKEQKPSLRIVLSLGGGGTSDGFSDMAADSLLRKAFAADCRHVADAYGLDGIDFDWEFPGNQNGRPEDPANFTLLLKEVRAALGDDKIISIAGGGDLPGVNASEVLDIIDYFNVMTYDLGSAPYHHTSLHRSDLTGWRSVDDVIEDYRSRGIPFDKMVLGLGFYGRADGVHFPQWAFYRDIIADHTLTECWDSVACVPYLVDEEGTLVVSYENPRSLRIKCDYIKDNGFLGGMYWRSEYDTDSMELARTVAEALGER